MAAVLLAVIVLAAVAYLARRLAGHWLFVLVKDLVTAFAWLLRVLFLSARSLIRFVCEEVRS